MPGEVKKQHPLPSIRRLPGYLHFLKQLKKKDIKQVSCTQISQELSLDSTQVRKDMALTGITGKPRIGYPLEALINAIENFLGWNKVTNAVLIGTGNLGKALIGYENFSQYGLKIIAAFDKDKDKVGKSIFGCMVYDVENITEITKKLNVNVAILTVPAVNAQQIAEILVENQFLAIWNFSPTKLVLPNEVIVENVELASSLAVLSCRMANR